MNENDIADILTEVRHWLVNGSERDQQDHTDCEGSQIARIIKLRTMLTCGLFEDLTYRKWFPLFSQKIVDKGGK